jgi:hypothetical protein
MPIKRKRTPTVTPPVTSLTGYSAIDSVVLQWVYSNPTRDFTHFEVKRNNVWVANVITPTYEDEDASNNTTYTYTVRAMRTNVYDGTEYFSTPVSVSVTTDFVVSLPDPPTGLVAEFTGDGATLSWNTPDTTPDSWTVWYSDTGPTGTFNQLISGLTATTYDDATAPSNAYRYGYVTAVHGGIQSAPSQIIGWHKLVLASIQETWSVQVNDPDETGVSTDDDLNWTSGTPTLVSNDAQWGRTGSTTYRNYAAHLKYKGTSASAGEITVQSAFFTGFARGAGNTTAMYADIRGHDIIPATPPTTIIAADAMPRTTASVAWDIPAITTWASGAPVSTPDLKTILQEMFDSHDVTVGDKIGLIIEPRVGVAVAGNLRTISSGDIATVTLRPTLTVTASLLTLQDTVAPAQPQTFAGVNITSALSFSWAANIESDLNHYELLQDGVVVDAFIAPTLTTAQYVPTDGDAHTYTLIAVDNDGNRSVASTGVASPFDVEDPVTNPAGFDSGYRIITIDLDVTDDTGNALSPNKLSGDYQIATTGSRSATQTTLPVNAMPIALPDGTPIPIVDNGVVKMAILNGASLKGATSLTVDPLAAGISLGAVLHFSGVMYSVTTLNDWRFGQPLYRTTDATASRLTGAIFELTPGTTYDVRISLLNTVADTEEVQLEQVSTYALPTLTETYAARDKTLGTGGDWTTISAMLTSLNDSAWWTTFGANHALIGWKNESFLRGTVPLVLPVGKTVTFKAETNAVATDRSVNGASWPMIYERFVSPQGVTDAQSAISTTVTGAWTEVGGSGSRVWQLDATAATGYTRLRGAWFSTTKTSALTKVAVLGIVDTLLLNNITNVATFVQDNYTDYHYGMWQAATGEIYFVAPTGSSFNPNNYYVWYSDQELGTANAEPALDINCPGVKIIGLKARGLSEGFRFRQNATDCAIAYCHDDGCIGGIWGFQSTDVTKNADRLYAYRNRLEDSSLWEEARPETLIPWDLVKQQIVISQHAVTSSAVGTEFIVLTVPGHDVVVGDEIIMTGASNATHNNVHFKATAVTSTTVTSKRGTATASTSSTGGTLSKYYKATQISQKSGETQGMRASRSGRFWHSEEQLFTGKFNGLGASAGTGRQQYWGWYSRNDEYTKIGDNPIEPDGQVSAVCWVIYGAYIHNSRTFVSVDSAYGPHYIVRSKMWRPGTHGVGADGSGSTDEYSGRGGAFFKGGTDYQPSALWFILHNTFYGDLTDAKGFTNAIGGGSPSEGYYLRNNIMFTDDYLLSRNSAVGFTWNENNNFFGSDSPTDGMQIGTTYLTIAAYRTGTSQGAKTNLIGGTNYDFYNAGAFPAAPVITGGLTSPTTGNLSLSVGSPFIDLGVPVMNVSSHSSQFNDNAPDMGAEETA